MQLNKNHNNIIIKLIIVQIADGNMSRAPHRKVWWLAFADAASVTSYSSA